MIRSPEDAPVVDPRLIGLARVSTDSQDTQLQRDALVQAGCARIFEETISTRSSDRPGPAAALDHLRPHAGDALVVWKLDRLGREVKDVLIIADDLHTRGIALRVLTGTLAGLDAARRQGRVGGRPTVMDADKIAAGRARRARGESPTQIAKTLGVSRATYYRHLTPRPDPTHHTTGDPPTPAGGSDPAATRHRRRRRGPIPIATGGRGRA